MGWLSARRLRLLLGASLIAGCVKASAPEGTAAPAATASPSPSPVALAVAFSEDDFDAATARAKQANKLLFVDGWAPWCHTCLSMREVVLSSPALGRFAADFEFVAVDTDRPDNAAFVERYHMRVWPTFFVIDPATGGVLGLYGGSVSLDELVQFLERSKAARGTADLGDRALADAHAAYGAGRLAEAARLYEHAAGSVADTRRAEPLVGAIRSYWEAEQFEDCARFGRAHLARVPGSSAPSDFALTLLECAKKLPAGDVQQECRALAREKLETLAASPPAGASVDDQADTLAALAEVAREDHDEGGARSLEQRRLALLDRAIAAAGSTREAHVHDYERMNALIALGRGEEAVSMLEARTREMPQSYEPFARLGTALLAVGRPAQAVAALDKAVALSYGPRQTRYLAQKAKAQLASGDRAGAIATLESELSTLRALPESQSDAKRVADAEARLAAARDPKAKVK